MSWEPLDPYSSDGEEVEDLHGEELEALVAFYKAVADRRGEPHDPEWDRWLAEDKEATDGD